MMVTAADHEFMGQALELAARGLYTTTPNPRVGCVIARDGTIVGAGWHEKAGMPHAEVLALKAAGARARGATLYVNLEPCSHHGRTPPCADAIIDAGVGRVVAAIQDPNPRVAGAGFARLRAAGIAVEHGLMEDEARELNIGFFARMTRGRPWMRSEEHTSELQSRLHLVCRLLLEKKKKKQQDIRILKREPLPPRTLSSECRRYLP